MGNCREDVNKPSVDETQIECCGIYPSNCVVSSEADTFLKYKKGETLTNILKNISDNIKKLFLKFNSLDRYYELTGVFSQSSSDDPIFETSSSNYVSTYSFTRIGQGDYNLIFSNPVLTTGTIVNIPLKNIPKYHTYSILDPHTINIKSYDEFLALQDGILQVEFINIKTPK